ncbi:MAG: ankyrin repeat domain-containing protein [Victivallales bacterium]|nr:ankyrin repeat domain-containing protein [Victivallales bacterium]
MFVKLFCLELISKLHVNRAATGGLEIGTLALFAFLLLASPVCLGAEAEEDDVSENPKNERRITPDIQKIIDEIKLLDEKEAFKALSAAVLSGNLNRTRVILHLNPQFLNMQDSFKQTPLFNAAFANKIEIVRFLVSRRADTSMANVNGDTPMHAAAENGWIEVVDYLISKGASIYLTNKNGETPLFRAVSGGHKDVALLLIDKGLLVDGMDLKHNTPLHKAAARGDSKMVDFLLSAGADKNKKNAEGQTPFDLANTPKIKERLREK